MSEFTPIRNLPEPGDPTDIYSGDWLALASHASSSSDPTPWTRKIGTIDLITSQLGADFAIDGGKIMLSGGSGGGGETRWFALTPHDVYSTKAVDTAYSNVLSYSIVVTVSTGQISGAASQWISRLYTRTTSGPGTWVLRASQSNYLYGILQTMVVIVAPGDDYKVTHSSSVFAGDPCGLGPVSNYPGEEAWVEYY